MAVMAPLEKNPQILMWGPDAFPDVTEVQDLPDGTPVVAFGPAAYLDWLVAEGIIDASQIDGSYNASPARFVGDGGKLAQQGFASAEPYIYENEVPEWGKPVQYQLIHDMGFEIYSQALAAKPDDVTKYSDCLEKFVPIAQQAAIDYVNDPVRTNTLILELVEAYDTDWVYSEGVAAFSAKVQAELGPGRQRPRRHPRQHGRGAGPEDHRPAGPDLRRRRQAHQGGPDRRRHRHQRVHRRGDRPVAGRLLQAS